MIDEAVVAADLAQAFLKVLEAEVGVDLVLTGKPVKLSNGHLFGYQARRFVEEGDFNHALAGNMPIFVNGLTGEASCTAERYDELRRAETEARRKPISSEAAEAYVERVGGWDGSHLKMTEVLTQEFGLLCGRPRSSRSGCAPTRRASCATNSPCCTQGVAASWSHELREAEIGPC
jgi:hypothetical protein